MHINLIENGTRMNAENADGFSSFYYNTGVDTSLDYIIRNILPLSGVMWCSDNVKNRSQRRTADNYAINRSGTMIVWDAVKCAINDELRLADYLGPPAPGEDK